MANGRGPGQRIQKVVRFRSLVEPPEPMRGLEVPRTIVDRLGGGRRPAVNITLNGHSGKSRVAIMRGRYLIGLSNANRRAAGVEIGDEVELSLELDTEPRLVVAPADLSRALSADPVARAAFERLTSSQRRVHVLAVEKARQPETRVRRIQKVVETLRNG